MSKAKKKKQTYLLITVYAEDLEEFRKVIDQELLDANVVMNWYDHDPRKFPPRRDVDFDIEDRGKPPNFCSFAEIEYGGSFRYGDNIFVRSVDNIGMEMGTGKRINFNEGTPVIPVKARLIIEDEDAFESFDKDESEG